MGTWAEKVARQHQHTFSYASEGHAPVLSRPTPQREKEAKKKSLGLFENLTIFWELVELKPHSGTRRQILDRYAVL